MRIRTVKPTFWKSLTMAKVPRDVRLTFIGLWNYVDDAGRAIADERLIKSELFPLDEDITPTVIRGHLDALVSVGRIVRYAEGDREYLAIPTFLEHQRISHPQPSACPPPPDDEASRNGQGTLTEHSALEGKGREQGKEGKERGTPRPRKTEKQAEQPRNPLIDALAAIEGANPAALTRPHARRLGVAVAEIKRATPDVTPSELRRRAGVYRRRHPEWELTGNALATHWASCDGSTIVVEERSTEPRSIASMTTEELEAVANG